MKTELDMPYDGHTVFSGTVRLDDVSSDCAYGTRGQTQAVVDEFFVFVWINGFAYDVTVAIPDKTLDGWKEAFLVHANEVLREGA